MTKEAAQPAGSAAKTMDCPKCQGAAYAGGLTVEALEKDMEMGDPDH